MALKHDKDGEGSVRAEIGRRWLGECKGKDRQRMVRGV